MQRKSVTRNVKINVDDFWNTHKLGVTLDAGYVQS